MPLVCFTAAGGSNGAWCSLVNILVWEASERQFKSDRPDMAKTKTSNPKEVVTVIADFELTSPEGTEKVKGFCAAWQRLNSLPTPANAVMVGWARIEK